MSPGPPEAPGTPETTPRQPSKTEKQATCSEHENSVYGLMISTNVYTQVTTTQAKIQNTLATAEAPKIPSKRVWLGEQGPALGNGLLA